MDCIEHELNEIHSHHKGAAFVVLVMGLVYSCLCVLADHITSPVILFSSPSMLPFTALPRNTTFICGGWMFLAGKSEELVCWKCAEALQSRLLLHGAGLAVVTPCNLSCKPFPFHSCIGTQTLKQLCTGSGNLVH